MDPPHCRSAAHLYGPDQESVSLHDHDHKVIGMYARCRSALQRTPVSRRIARRLPLLIGLVLGLLVWTASRVHHGAPLLPVSSFLGFGKAEVIVTKPERPRLPGTDRPQWEPGMCNVSEIEFLRRQELGLTSSIVYSRRCIKPVRSKAGRDVVANITTPLITTKTKVNLTDCSQVELPPCEAIQLQVSPAYPKKQYRHLIFGVATTYERLNQSLPEFAHWLSGTGAQLLAIVADADDPNTHFNLTALEALYASQNLLATFIPPTIKKRIFRIGEEERDGAPIPVEQHHFLLVRELDRLAKPGVTRWLTILDDDTFFPSLFPLDAELARHDHTKQTWLGALSDDFNSVRAWGYMAFGGAGVFLSPPLAAEVARRSEQCLREATTHTGDGLLRDCIYSHTRTTLTLVSGLFQHDFRGDPSGFFESGVHALSLHHWKSWYRAPVAAISRVATLVCGDCLLQRWRFGNDTLLSNGYSIAVYAEGVLPGLDLDRVEGTWSHATRDYDPTYGLLRPKVKEGDKTSYILKDAVMEEREDGEKVFRQLYVYRPPDEGWELDRPIGVDEVVELVWEL